MEQDFADRLPLGTSSFEKLRERNFIYVDKTDLVFKLTNGEGKYFLARPRRFGKSLLISTFESLFQNGLRNFKGLKIEKLWKDERTYKVVRLDFSRVKPDCSFQEFQDYFDEYVSAQFQKIGFQRNPGARFTIQLETFISSLPNSSLVLLIDEYDAPLTSCLDQPELFKKVRSYLSKFYSIIKSNDAALRFLFITGITKFNKTSIFSELNNLSDISLSPEFGQLLGYNHEEIEQYFNDYLINSAKILRIKKDILLKKLTECYDGFCFERTAKQKVFSPWSLLKFFADPKSGFIDYWFESGGRPSVLVKYLQCHSLRNPEEYAKEKSLPLNVLSGSSELDSLSDIGLLTQAGYLTIKRIEGATAYVGYPNVEVKTAMAQLYIEQLLSGRTLEQVGADRIAYRLAVENDESIVQMLNKLFASIDYQHYPVRDEASIRAFVQVFFAGAGLDPAIEHHNFHGRSDLEVNAGSRHWIFEFKVVRSGQDPEIKIHEALCQIEKRMYGADSQNRELKRIALVYSLEKRSFVRWCAAK